MNDNILDVLVRDDEIVLSQKNIETHNKRINIMMLEYNLTVEEAEQLINMLRDAIDIIEAGDL